MPRFPLFHRCATAPPQLQSGVGSSSAQKKSRPLQKLHDHDFFTVQHDAKARHSEFKASRKLLDFGIRKLSRNILRNERQSRSFCKKIYLKQQYLLSQILFSNPVLVSISAVLAAH